MALRLAYRIKKRLNRLFLSLLSDEMYARVKYRDFFGRKLNLENPRLYSEKIQFLKLMPEFESYGNYADKYQVRDYVTERIGSSYLNELLGVYTTPDQIPYGDLPDKFALKVTHGSGLNIIVEDKSKLDIAQTNRTLKKWLKMNVYRINREPQYKHITPCIICEKYLTDADGELCDYKIHCYHGVPRFIQYDSGRFSGHCRNLYSPDWELLPVLQMEQRQKSVLPNCPEEIPRPSQLEEMLDLARKLDNGFTAARMDFYIVNGKVYFGEITFHPASGLKEFEPREYSLKLASYLTLPPYGDIKK